MAQLGVMFNTTAVGKQQESNTHKRLRVKIRHVPGRQTEVCIPATSFGPGAHMAQNGENVESREYIAPRNAFLVFGQRVNIDA